MTMNEIKDMLYGLGCVVRVDEFHSRDMNFQGDLNLPSAYQITALHKNCPDDYVEIIMHVGDSDEVHVHASDVGWGPMAGLEAIEARVKENFSL